jgi:GTP pyrophosphokinase
MSPSAATTARTPASDRNEALFSGLGADDRRMLERALEYARSAYQERLLGTGERTIDHAIGLAENIAALRLDAQARAAGLLFAVPSMVEAADDKLRAAFGEAVARLVSGITKLNQLRVVTRSLASDSSATRQSQAEVLRKMLLAMVEDIRVVLLRLASRTQTLRFLAGASDEARRPVAQETLDIYAPLASRLGVWQLKWELEDLSFRFLEPEVYQQIAHRLDQRRDERESYLEEAIGALKRELEAAGVRAEISGRPKHLYSIWNKMRVKSLEFSQVHDVRAVRVLVDEIKDCYTALGIAHNLWQPIPKEFDDYISRPKGNFYRSLHTAVIGPDGRALEVQIRTHEMHRHAELGVAAHWRYKEGGAGGAAAVRSGSLATGRAAGAVAAGTAGGARADPFDQKIAFLRQVLAWRDDVVDSSDWVEQFKHAALDDTVYVLTPQGRVIDLPQGATPIDFAYALHTDLGHRCRGARVDGVMVPLDTTLANGERVEIVSAKTGGPSRDWLNPALGYIRSSRARNKLRQWFNSQELAQTIADGRAVVEREMQREGKTGANLEQLARQFEFDKTDDFYAAVGRDEIGTRQLQTALRGPGPAQAEEPQMPMHEARAAPGASGILVVGVDRLMTQLARCCKPAPPDAISGFVTRGRGVSIHRRGCSSLAQLLGRFPEREISAGWGAQSGTFFAVDVVVLAADRPGLLHDISEVLSREHINVTAVNTQSKQGTATMFFTVEVGDLAQLNQTLAMVKKVRGVHQAARR